MSTETLPARASAAPDAAPKHENNGHADTHDDPHGNPHGGQHGDQHGDQHGGPAMDMPPIGTGKVILLVAIFAALFGVLFLLGYLPTLRDRHLAEKEAAAAGDVKPIVDVAQPRAPAEVPTLQLPGSAMALQETNIYPRTSGYLKRRLADIGDRVKADQVLAEIETPEVDAQLAAAHANLQQAQANATRNRDDFELAQTTYDRYVGFSKGGGVTQQQLDEKKSAFTSAKSNLAAAEATVASDQADLQRLTALQSYEQVRAPFEGTVTARNFDVGALMSDNSTGPGREMFTIAQTDLLRVFVNVPQTYASHVKPGQPAYFVVTNYPGRKFQGTIARTAGAIDQNSRTLRVEVDVKNDSGELFAGMYGYIRYELPETQQNQLMIPTSALVFGPDGTQVATLDGSNKVKYTRVMLGRDLGTEVEVIQGLTAADRIVANPGERLTDGIEVKVTKKESPDTKLASAPPSGNKIDGEREASAK